MSHVFGTSGKYICCDYGYVDHGGLWLSGFRVEIGQPEGCGQTLPAILVS